MLLSLHNALCTFVENSEECTVTIFRNAILFLEFSGMAYQTKE